LAVSQPRQELRSVISFSFFFLLYVVGKRRTILYLGNKLANGDYKVIWRAFGEMQYRKLPQPHLKRGFQEE